MLAEQLELFDFPSAAQETYGITNKKLASLARGRGCRCPLCRQTVKVYRRPLTGAMCVALIKIHQAYCRYKWVAGDPEKSIHVEGLLKRCEVSSSVRGDFCKLRYWGLIEKVEKERADGSKRNGHYRLTVKGRQFVMRECAVKSHSVIYNNTFYGLEGTIVSIIECLGKKFNYDKLMEAY